MKSEIISIGVDLGTSTTQLVFSKIIIENSANSYMIPKFTISHKEIIYESEIIFTPLLSKEKIDINKIKDFIIDEYKKAQINFEDVKTGAVIITGEAAKKENAENVLNSLSGFAGEFVVATAGPNLESSLAGKGANADELSKKLNSSVVNIDIGGGTSNISFFNKGKLMDVTCVDIGGRLIQIDKNTNKISYIAPKIKYLSSLYNMEISEGDIVNIEKLRDVCSLMVKIISSAVNLSNYSFGYSKIITSESTALKSNLIAENITFSGGVGKYVYENEANLFKYEDIGIILSQEIKKSKLFSKTNIIKPKETIRATVVGAGMHTTEISGSTIYYEKDELPIKNIPVVKIEDSDVDNMKEVIGKNLNFYFENSKIGPIVIAFSGKNCTTFNSIQNIAENIISSMKFILKNNYPIIIVTEEDIAKALGHAICSKLENYKKVICIDKISVSNGDYIDIGKPINQNVVVPVVVKTLIFNT